MPQRRFRRAFFSGFVAALATGGGALAQTVESPLVPRGALVVHIAPQATNLEELFGPSGRTPIGSAFDGVVLGSSNVPGLVPVAERFSALAQSPASGVVLGTTYTRFSGDERNVPIGLSFGVLDRLTVGVTVPLVRKRLETVLALSPTGGDVGANPQLTDSGTVSAFLLAAQASLGEVDDAVNTTCLAAGEGDPECRQGRSLVSDASVFLDGLDTAYAEEAIFPFAESTIGVAIGGRWADYLTEFADWGSTGPDDLPLAETPVDQATFESLAVGPTWGVTGFPTQTPEAVLGLGDVEISAALGILEPQVGPDGGPIGGVQVALAAMGTARFGTGEPDSLRIVAPMEPPRGTSGFSFRTVGDVLLPGRFAVLGTFEAGWSGSVETTVFAPDPTRVFTPDAHATRVRWTPGSHVSVRVAPRFRLAPGLYLGAGWETLRRSADDYETVAEEGIDAVPVTAPLGDITLHSASLEIRYSAMDGSFAERVPFPVEVLFRATRAVAGSDGAPAQNRAEALVRFRVRDFRD